MATSRSRTRRRTQRPNTQQAPAGYHQDATYAQLDIITTDNLKDGAVAELTPPSGQWALPVAPVSKRNIDEDSSLGFQALPVEEEKESTQSWLQTEALPVNDSATSAKNVPQPFSRAETVELHVADAPLPISQAETIAVSKMPEAAVLETEALAKPVDVVFDDTLEIEEVDEIEVDDEREIIEPFTVVVDDEAVDEDRSVTTVIMNRSEVVEHIAKADTEIAAKAISETEVSDIKEKRRSVLRSPLLLILGASIGYAAAQWSELFAFYANVWS